MTESFSFALRGLGVVVLSLIAWPIAYAQDSDQGLMVDVGVDVTCSAASEARTESLIARELRYLGDAQRVRKAADFVISVACVPVEMETGSHMGVAFRSVVISFPRTEFFARTIEEEDERLASLFRSEFSGLVSYHYAGIGVVPIENAEQSIAEHVVAEFDNKILIKERAKWRQ